jgi:beta-1,4-mannosyl-glycoprotein beta-1,4-N-acetylglucosaminyltransferase
MIIDAGPGRGLSAAGFHLARKLPGPYHNTIKGNAGIWQMIYDCFIFFNELELLELRLNELAGVVDRFVLVEAGRTFTNKAKPLFFLENRDRFHNFKDKIIHVVVEDSPDTTDPWTIERFQRNCIARGLTQCRPDDWILVSDVDEIPRAATVKRISVEHSLPTGFWPEKVCRPLIHLFSSWKFSRGRVRRNHPYIFKFQQTNHRHFLNCVTVAPPEMAVWHGTRMLFHRDYYSAQEIRHGGYKIVKNGGWHFTSMGGVERIQEKVRSFSHQEFNRPELLATSRVAEMLAQGKSVFHPSEVLQFTGLDDSYPRYVLEHPDKFSSWIKPV